MQFKSKNLLLTLSTILGLGLLTAADCSGDNNSGSSTPTPPPPPGAPKVDVKVEEWKQLKNGTGFAIGAANKVDILAVSGDGSHAYASVGRDLFVNELSSEDDITNDSKWSKVDFSATKLAPSAGKIANVSATITGIHRLSPTKNGVLVSGNHTSPGDTVGLLALLAGKDFKATWAPLSGANTHIGTNGVVTGSAINGGILRRSNDKEYVVGQYQVGDAAYNVNQNLNFDAGDVSVPGVAAVAGSNYERAAVNFAGVNTSGVHFYAVVGSGANTKSMIIAKEGLSVYADPTHPCSNNNIANVAPEGHLWTVSGGAANDIISTVVSDNKRYVYIAFKIGGNNNKGGVAVYDATTPASTPANVHANWKGKEVLDVAIDGSDQAWAVMKDKIVKIKTDGSLGDELKAATALPADGVKKADENKSFSKGVALPNANIAGAKFVKGALVIATADAGLIVRLPEKTEQVTEKK